MRNGDRSSSIFQPIKKLAGRAPVGPARARAFAKHEAVQHPLKMNPDSTLLGDVLLFCIAGLMMAHTLSLISRKRLLLLDPLFAFWAGILVIYIGQPLSYRQIFIEWHSDGTLRSNSGLDFIGTSLRPRGATNRVLGLRLGLKLPQAPAKLSPVKLTIAGYGLVFLGVLGFTSTCLPRAGGVNEWLSVGRGGTDYENISGYVAQLTRICCRLESSCSFCFKCIFIPRPSPNKSRFGSSPPWSGGGVYIWEVAAN